MRLYNRRASYIRVLIDLGVVVQHGGVQGDDIILPDPEGFLVVKVKQEVFFGNTDIHGGAGQTHGFLDDAVCNEK